MCVYMYICLKISNASLLVLHKIYRKLCTINIQAGYCTLELFSPLQLYFSSHHLPLYFSSPLPFLLAIFIQLYIFNVNCFGFNMRLKICGVCLSVSCLLLVIFFCFIHVATRSNSHFS